jgi:hypothetical protein
MQRRDMSVDEVVYSPMFTFTGVARPGELYSEESAHPTASTLNERLSTVAN